MFKCECCKETFNYRDEVIILDCNGENALDEEQGGSGDTYGTLCYSCYENGEETYLLRELNNFLRNFCSR